MVNTNFWRTLYRTVLYGILLVMTFTAGSFANLTIENIYAFTSEDAYVALDAHERSRGVTTDGESWYFGGGKKLVKASLNADDPIKAVNRKAVSADLRSVSGGSRLGGLTIADGTLYAAVEDAGTGALALYDAQTLDFVKCVKLDHMDKPAAWVACDADAGLLYASHEKTQDIFVYDLSALTYRKTVRMHTPVDSARGAELYKGYLYIATNDTHRAVYRCDLTNGVAELYFDRFTCKSKRGGTGGDITVLPMADGSLFHVLHSGVPGIDAELRHYAPVPGMDLEPKPDDDPPGPVVRYLKKYVIDILSDDSYTMQTEHVTEDGIAIPLTIYKDADNLAYEMTVSELMAAYMQQEFALLGKIAPSSKIKFILKDTNSSNPGMYLCLPTGYIDFREVMQSTDDTLSAEDIKQEFQMLVDGADQYMTREYGSLEYINTILGDNYVCESYRSPDKSTGYSFYFTSRGLARIEEVDLSTNKVTQSTKIVLTRGVTDKKVFEPSGKKMDANAIRKLFEGLS